MSKRIEFYNENHRFDKNLHGKDENKIREILNQEFCLPDVVDQAKSDAFEKIRAKAETGKKDIKSLKRRKYKTVAGIAAAGAVFSTICITNPALAEEIPLIGSVFARIGTSLGFAGDYEKYASKLEEQTEDTEGVKTEDSKGKIDREDSTYSKTSNGITITMNEVYCNDTALNLAFTVESENPLPDTMINENTGVPVVYLGFGTEMPLSYNPDFKLNAPYLDGQIIDAYTYAGVLRVDLEETNYNDSGSEQYYEAQKQFLMEKGVDQDALTEGEISFEEAADILGIPEFTEEYLSSIGMPDPADYDTTVEIPEEFTVGLNIKSIHGYRPADQHTTPEMPGKLKEEYNEALAEKGLDINDYESFTEEEKEFVHQLDTKMYNKYIEIYPEMAEPDNEHNTWSIEGNWEFSLPVKKNLEDTVTKEINLVDEEGYGVVSVTKTPFEIQLNEATGGDYICTVLDADGVPLSYGNQGGDGRIFAVKNRNVSKIYVYVCDWTEYMDELKGYYWSEDYKEKKKEKTYKEYLDERAVLHTEVVFEQ